MTLRVPVRLIPAVAAIGAWLPGCGGDPIVGAWEVTQLRSKVLPWSYTYDGTTYTGSARLTFESDGELEYGFALTSGDDFSLIKAYVYTGSWARDGRAYLIQVDGDALDCTISEGELECDVDGARVLEAVPADD